MSFLGCEDGGGGGGYCTCHAPYCALYHIAREDSVSALDDSGITPSLMIGDAYVKALLGTRVLMAE